MHAPRFISASLTLFASSAAVLFVSSASAAGNTCALDTDCPTGFSCQVIGASGGCASAPCEPGTICPPIDCPPPTEIKGCMPGPCATDADCATGMVCYTYTETICSATTAPAPSCPPNTVCPTPVPEPSGGGCTTSQNQQCVPKYALPCTVDFDCGDGFMCVHDQQCSASGSGGTGVPTPAGEPGGAAGSSGSGSSGTGSGTAGTSGSTPPSGSGDVPPPLPPSCTTLPTAHCEVKNTTCQTAADCPSQWTCEQMIPGGGMTCAGMASTDPTMPPPPPVCTTTPTVTVSQCVPPYYNLGFRSAQDGTANLGSTETGTTKSGTAGTTGGGTPPTSGGPTGTDPNPSGTGGTSNTGTGTSANHAAGGASSQDSGGCQVALSHTSSSGTALLGLLGFLGLSRRRRSRAV